MSEHINQLLREHEEAVSGWDYADAGRHLYLWFDRVNNRFFDATLATPVLSFKRTRGRYGHYVPGRNEIGVLDNINISASHLSDPLSEVLSTLAHEMAHAWEENFGKPGSGSYHNNAFRRKLDEIGIPCDQWGHGQGIRDPFLSFLREHGITAEDRLISAQVVQMTKTSGSPLKKWNCGCTSIWACTTVAAECITCGGGFVRA